MTQEKYEFLLRKPLSKARLNCPGGLLQGANMYFYARTLGTETKASSLEDIQILVNYFNGA